MAPHTALRVSRELHKLEAVRLALTAAEQQVDIAHDHMHLDLEVVASQVSAASHSLNRALTLLGEAHAALDKIAEEA